MAQTPVRNHVQRGNNQQYARMTLSNPQRHVVPTTVLTKSKLVPITAARPVTAVVPKTHVTKLRQAKPIVTKPHSPPRRHINRSTSPKASNFPPKVTAAKASMVDAVKGNWGNPQHALKDKGVIDSGCSRHITGNMSYLSDFEELNGGYVAFGGNPKGGLESIEARLLVYQQNEYVFKEDIKLLKLEVQLRDNALVVIRQNFEKAEQERDDLKLKLEKFQTSSKNLSDLLASQTNDKIGLGYNSQVFTRAMFDCDDCHTFGSDESLPPSPIYDRYQSGDGYHAVPPPYTGTFMPPKPDLVFYNAPSDVETVHTTFNIELSPTKPDNDLSDTHRPSAPIIKDWVSDSEDES
nr:hypothetical protein [Tanacetum cinerariifolium]